ncbi:MAG: ShlB/FhaC/HecB family hemolysin secretion/activation protein [Leptospirales bacterium]|nr:ShlB/FhaC/HecB family hemolysin secretion/activation protein [Leptospirales bacterium]
MLYKFVKYIAFIFPLLFSYAVFAEVNTTEEALREIKRRQDIVEQDLREKRKAEAEKKEGQKESGAEKKPALVDTTKFVLKEIIIENDKNLSWFEKRRLVGRLLNREITFNDIAALVRELTNLMIDKGYSTARVKIPVGQNISSGKFTINIINGYIEEVESEEKGLRNGMQIFMAFPFYAGRYLNIHELEYALEQVNRLGYGDAAMKITPGGKEGMSKILVANTPGLSVLFEPGTDNLGQKATGEIRAKLFTEIDNLLSVNDSISFDYAGTPGFDNDKKHSRVYTFYFSFPLGFWNFSAAYSRSEYMQIIDGLSTRFKTSGIDCSEIFFAERLIFMKGYHRIKAKANFTLKQKESYIEDAKISSASRNLSVLKGGFDYSGFLFGGYFSVGAFYHAGVKWFNAYRDESGERDVPKAQFGKHEANLLWNRQFILLGRRFGYTFNALGQYGRDTLFNSEKISIGGSNTVRGFKDFSISGDSGFYVRNDLAMHDFSFIWSALRGLKLFAGIDYGFIREKTGSGANYGQGRAALTGCAAGFVYVSPVIRGSLTYSRRLSQPEFVSEKEQVVYFSVSLPLNDTYRMIRETQKRKEE